MHGQPGTMKREAPQERSWGASSLADADHGDT
jgi:hypothetical protein